MKKYSVNQQSEKASMRQRIKVKLDYKTTIIINRLSSLKIWRKRYPLAHIIH